MSYIIDNLQYAYWSKKIFGQMRQGKVDAVHATIAYHETFEEVIQRIQEWNERFEKFGDIICRAKNAEDVRRAKKESKTAILFGIQNSSQIGEDVRKVEILHQLGIRFMQLTYNNQSLIASGYMEKNDTGVTRFGKEVIREMNRVGVVVDMSHAAKKSTLQAIKLSKKPVAVTHANPTIWHKTPRNVSEEVIKALAESGGMLGFSIYPHHLKDGSRCSLKNFCEMIARVATKHGTKNIGIGSDLCQDQPDKVVDWMRSGKWKKQNDEGAKFPEMPKWFKDNRDFQNIARGLKRAGFNQEEVSDIMGDNWFRFYVRSFGSQ